MAAAGGARGAPAMSQAERKGGAALQVKFVPDEAVLRHIADDAGTGGGEPKSLGRLLAAQGPPPPPLSPPSASSAVCACPGTWRGRVLLAATGGEHWCLHRDVGVTACESGAHRLARFPPRRASAGPENHLRTGREAAATGSCGCSSDRL